MVEVGIGNAEVGKLKTQMITNRLMALGNKEQAAVSQRFFKTGPGQYGEGDSFIGIKVPVLRTLAKEYLALPLKDLQKILASKYHETRLLSLLIMVGQFSKGNHQQKKFIYELYLKNTRFINNWDLVDASAHHIVGPYLMDKNRAPLYKLAQSDLLWERRIAIMSTFYYIKNHEFTDTMRIAGMLLSDPEDLIHKAVGWMLREIGKCRMQLEEAFLKKHYQNMPRTMLRYAIEKFPEPKRQRYLKGRI